jgi:serine/threonine protein kinase
MPFLEDYILLDELGQGGFATVYKVKHRSLGYIRAVRVLHQLIAKGEEDKTYQKFLRECRILLRLGNGNHPNIVHIYQPLLRSQKAIVEMDYVDGEDLTHYMKSRSSFVPAAEVLRMVSDIGSALAYCHEDIYKFCMDRNEDDLKDDPEDGAKVLVDNAARERLIEKYKVIHNDIHSGNVIRRDSGSYVLLDFGLAIDGDEVVRSSRAVNGAPEFKAPEKWDNESILTPQSDIYSFGVLMYEFLTGRVPFPLNKGKAFSLQDLFRLGNAHKTQMPDSIYEVRKAAYENAFPGQTYERDFPVWLEDLIMKCLEKSPEDRFRNGKELYEYFLIHSEGQNDVSEHIRKEMAALSVRVASLQQENRQLTDINTKLKQKCLDLENENKSLHEKISCRKEDESKYEWVDLELPSGLKWASCNIGAYYPEDFGYHFEWGEVVSVEQGNAVTSAYKNHADDTAAVIWGGRWRMPYEHEFQELMAYCFWNWTKLNGIPGYKVMSKTNGKSIFLPAAGRTDHTGKFNLGHFGYYWTLTPDANNPNMAFFFYFNAQYRRINNNYRNLGRNIRPVMK